MMLDLAWAVDDFVSSFGEIGSHIYDDTGRSPDAQAQKEGQDAADRQRESPWICMSKICKRDRRGKI